MSFKSIYLKRAYSSDCDDIVNTFYIPVLENAVEYKRIAGFFSSSSLAIAAKGIVGLIKSGGIYKLIVSAKLNKQDINTILRSQKRPEEIIETRMMDELTHLEDEFVKDHLFALGWMIANKKLNIKVAITYNTDGEILSSEDVERSSLFHQKVGVLTDEERNVVAFSGSINETATGWLENIEEFKVFRSWERTEHEYVEIDTAKFGKFWNNESLKVRTVGVPEAVEKKLIEIAPSDIATHDLTKWYQKTRRSQKIMLYKHQRDAVAAWLQHDKRGIFEMATATGKTYAALECLSETSRQTSKLVIVIVCPYSHLVTQWYEDLGKFGITYVTVIADSSNNKWRNELTDALLDVKNDVNEKLIVITSHDTFPTVDFTNIISVSDAKLLLIIDEVHGIGAPQRRLGLAAFYDYRLGLSATPKRWFDLEGTDELFTYFGNTVYEFQLKEAVHTINPRTGKTFLCPYDYEPYFVELTDEELYTYEKETAKIAKAYYQTQDKVERNKWFSLLLINRQKIVRNAANKLNVFKEILNEIGDIRDCLVYCSPQQMDDVQNILNTYEKQTIVQHKFTSKEGITPDDRYDGMSEREYLIRKFEQGEYHVLVAMKCLDEGIDVPSVRTAIILASTGNPREYVQRRGRLLRRSPNKEKAVIYDVLVIPGFLGSNDPAFVELERRIFKKELVRYKEFASIAANALQCLLKVEEVENRFDRLL